MHTHLPEHLTPPVASTVEPPLITGTSKARETLQFLQRKISSGEWDVGKQIPKEVELMGLVGAGRSTVREAVRVLTALGMLQPVPGRGTFVRSRSLASELLGYFLSDHDLGEILVFRRSLEIEAAQAAAAKRSEPQLAALELRYERDIVAGHDASIHCFDFDRPDSFHRLIFEASNSRLLIEMYSGVMARLKAAAVHGQIVFASTHGSMHASHGNVLKAIRRRSMRDAVQAMALHADRDLGLRPKLGHLPT